MKKLRLNDISQIFHFYLESGIYLDRYSLAKIAVQIERSSEGDLFSLVSSFPEKQIFEDNGELFRKKLSHIGYFYLSSAEHRAKLIQLEENAFYAGREARKEYFDDEAFILESFLEGTHNSFPKGFGVDLKINQAMEIKSFLSRNRFCYFGNKQNIDTTEFSYSFEVDESLILSVTDNPTLPINIIKKRLFGLEVWQSGNMLDVHKTFTLNLATNFVL